MGEDKLLMEARQDIKDIKDSLASIDKNTAISASKIEELSFKVLGLEKRQESVEENLNLWNATMKLFGISGGVIIFLVEVIPYLKKMFS